MMAYGNDYAQYTADSVTAANVAMRAYARAEKRRRWQKNGAAQDAREPRKILLLGRECGAPAEGGVEKKQLVN